MLDRLPEYWKGIIAAVGAIAIAVQTAVSDDVWTDAEKITVALAVVAFIGVVLKRNKPPAVS